MGAKCLAQEHNTVPRPGLEPGPFDPESSALTNNQMSVQYMNMDVTIIIPWVSSILLLMILSCHVSCPAKQTSEKEIIVKKSCKSKTV